ncbi:MAG: S8 family serine peptidase [Eubacteriales bacterium]|nr:S8 family serine peptidase [Eubacteriales bacterium]
MLMKRSLVLLLMLTLVLVAVAPAAAAPDPNIGINVVLKAEITDAALNNLSKYGRVVDVMDKLNALTMKIKSSKLADIQKLPFVAAANPDATRQGAPIDTVAATDFIDGLSTWNLDAINVTDVGFNNRQVAQDGSGVYVAVLDTGLMDSWRRYFPEERIAEEYARSFGGGGGVPATVSEQPNKWEHDVNGHGTHVTSTIIGYQYGVNLINGVAPKATIIPVKVLNQNGSGWSSVIARGIEYIGDLKAGPLADYPVVINMSLGGSVLDAVEKAAIDYAIAQGVIIVASAGNNGTRGMGYPGAYEPVISVAAAGSIGEWSISGWWYAYNDIDPQDAANYYIVDFSSRQLAGQDLDVAAPGSWIVGPYQLNSGMRNSYYYLGGTSMASPHVAGTVALMAQKNPALTAASAESILESTALYLAPGTRTVYGPSGAQVTYEWGADATGSGLVNAAAALDAIP